LPKSLNTLINCCTAPSSLLWPLARENWLLDAQGFLSWPLLASRLYQIICTHRKLLLWLLLPIGQWINSSAPPFLRHQSVRMGWGFIFFGEWELDLHCKNSSASGGQLQFISGTAEGIRAKSCARPQFVRTCLNNEINRNCNILCVVDGGGDGVLYAWVGVFRGGSCNQIAQKNEQHVGVQQLCQIDIKTKSRCCYFYDK